MTITKEHIIKAIDAALAEGKGKRKFTQSVDLAVGFKDVDFNKAENRLNLDIVLPHPPRKAKIAIYADATIMTKAREVADLIIMADEIPVYASDKKKQKQLLDYNGLAAPSLMVPIGKALGQFLGAKGRLPKPVMPNADLKEVVERTRRTINIKSKGKYLPAVSCIVGNENMPTAEIAENVLTIFEAIEKKVPEHNIKSVFIKTTMGKPARVL